ncbi:unnamed protein product [Discosporangium mesarthrocarpum]
MGRAFNSRTKGDNKNRRKKTPIMKLATINGERYQLMVEEFIPAIKARMPRPPGHTIFVQQDDAKPHTGKGVKDAIQDAAGDDIYRKPILPTHLTSTSMILASFTLSSSLRLWE